MVVRRLSLDTKLPCVMRARDTRPSMGARTSVNSRFNLAALSAAVAAATSLAATLSALDSLSNSSREMR